MIYECRVYSPSGKLKQVHNEKFLKKIFWDKFDDNPLRNPHGLNGIDQPAKDKRRPHTAQKRYPKKCKWCKNEFIPTHPKVKTCGPKCKKEYLNDYFKRRRILIKNGLVITFKRGPSKRRNIPRI